MKIFKKSIWIALTSVFGVFTIGLLVGTMIVMENASAAINMALGTSSFIKVNNTGEQAKDLYTTDYDFITKKNKYEPETSEALFEEDKSAIEKAAGEGMVLLWNKNSALPLSGSEKKISLFAYGSYAFVEGGTGSGYIITESLSGKNASISMKDAFTDKGFSVNETLWNLYKNYSSSRTNPKTDTPEWQQWKVDELPWSKYTNSITDSFSQYGDVAFITISRSGGEYSDLHYNYDKNGVSKNDAGSGENLSKDGGYLGLTNQEDELISKVLEYKNSGTFKKVVLLLNTANPLMFKDFSNYFDGIDACLWVGQPGSSGVNAMVDIIRGSINPSGRITDTFPYDLNSAPSSENDGNYVYKTLGVSLPSSEGKDNRYNTYMVYQEGIYVGYRYYETRYEDQILNQGNAQSTKGAKNSKSNWDYKEEVAFPFGYGDSYTKFEYSNFKVEQNKTTKDYKVSVKVKNVGESSGKEAVQVYLQKPYTAYDKTNLIEKASVELKGFAKTKLLAKNASETVEINIPFEEFKTYDANNKKTYIIEQGDYYLTIANDAHNAINNILEAKQSSNLETNYFKDYAKHNNVSLGKNFASKITISSNDFVTFSTSTQNGSKITNQFDNGDINKYVNRGSNSVTYLSRSNWEYTYPHAPELTVNAQMAKDLLPDTVPNDQGIEMPTYNTFKSGADGVPDTEKGDLVAQQFMEAPLWPELDDPNKLVNGKTNAQWSKLWNQLLDQMSWDEQAQMAANSYHLINGAVSIALPSCKQENGPVGITHNSKFGVADPEITNYYFVCYPCASVLAASFNIDVAENIGKHMSEDMLFLGYTGIYGPGVNLHRSPYGGRAYEYPSEDPYLAGLIEYNESKGIETKGCMAYAKHFALNDQETNRRHVGIWSNEQATREIYLKAFELTFAEGGASATMNSFSRVGTKWNGGCIEMMTNILRKEWGWTGINITDWRGNWSNAPMSFVDGIMAGTNMFDGNQTKTQYEPYKNNAAVCQALRDSARIVIYNVVRTNIMNGISLGNQIININPWWVSLIHAIDGVFVSLFAVSACFLIACFFVGNKKDKETKEYIDDSDRKIRIFKKEIPVNKLRTILAFSLGSIGLASVLISALVPIIGDEIVRSKAYKQENKIVDIEIPEDTDENKKTTRFEFEDGIYKGATQTSGTNYNHICSARSLYYNSAFSNGICLRNTSSSAITNSVTFKFNSSKTLYASVKIHLASKRTGSSSWAESNLSEAMTIKNNDERVKLSEVKVPKATSTNMVDSSSYFAMVDTSFKLPIFEGKNELVFTFTVNQLNCDYFDITTSSEISGFVKECTWGNPDEILDVSVAPTTSTTGTLLIKCLDSTCSQKQTSFTLPILNESNYSLREDGDSKFYSTIIYGKKFEFEAVDTQFEPAVGNVHNKSKTVNLIDGKDFFDPTNWYGNGSEDVKSTIDNLLNEAGELVFQNAPQWNKTASLRSTLLNVVKKDDGTTFTHPLDDWDNVKTDASFASIFGIEFDYDFTIKSNGGFTFMFGGVKKSSANPDDNGTNNALYFSFDGNNVNFIACGGNGRKSSDEIYAECPLTFDGETEMHLKLGITRFDSGHAVIKLYVNGNKINLSAPKGISSAGNEFSVVDGNIVNTTIAVNGYGQRIGINLPTNTILKITNLSLNNFKDNFDPIK